MRSPPTGKPAGRFTAVFLPLLSLLLADHARLLPYYPLWDDCDVWRNHWFPRSGLESFSNGGGEDRLFALSLRSPIVLTELRRIWSRSYLGQDIGE